MTTGMAQPERSGVPQLRRLAFAGGGSGGHLTPALALCEELLAADADCACLFLTSRREVDARLLRNFLAQTPLLSRQDQIRVQPLSATVGRELLRAPWRGLPRLVNGCREALCALRQWQPQLVVGLGGFASVAPVLAAWWLGIPVVLLEQNVVPGQATRWLARLARATCFGLPPAQAVLDGWPHAALVTGIPLRRGFQTCDRGLSSGGGPAAGPSDVGTDVRGVRADVAAPGAEQLLVLGGSQGAAGVNRLVEQMLLRTDAWPADWPILQQTGWQDLTRQQSAAAGQAQRWQVVDLLPDTAAALRQATLVISRAGATTLAELAACGVPSILLPLPSAAGGHQRANAAWLARHEAALVVDEAADSAAQDLALAIRTCVQQAGLRAALAGRISQLARPAAAQAVLDVLRRQLPSG